MKKIILIFTFIMLCVSLMAQNSAILKLNLEKNKVYRLKLHSEQSTAQTVNGNRQSTDSKIDYSMSLKMLDVTADFMITEIHFDTLITNTNTMGKTIYISSAVEGNIKSSDMGEIMSGVMNKLSKTAMFVKMDFTGKANEIINARMISDIIAKDTSFVTLTGPVGDAVKKQIVNTVSDNNLKTMIERFTSFLPGKEVAKGDSWNSIQQTNSGGMALVINANYHLDAINGNFASITSESSIKPPENATPLQQGSATITYDNLRGMSKSNMVIDISTGLINDVKAKSQISGNLGISAPGVSMQMPMEIIGESTVKALQ